MANFKDRIEKALKHSNSTHTVEQEFEEITFWLAKELHISPSELLEMPTPLVISLTDQLSHFMKEKAKAAKKKR